MTHAMAYAETDTCWHLMVRTRGGKVSIMKNLDAPTARQAYQRLCPDTHPVEYINLPEKGGMSWGDGLRYCSDSDIERVSILGPEGADLDPWRGVEPRIIDMMPERKRQEEAAERARKRRAEADEKAARLNIIPELRPQLTDHQFRCAQCSKMQPAGSLLFYLPDGLRKTDPVEIIKERIEASRWNGSSSGWCASCVPKAKAGALSSTAPVEKTPPPVKSPWWKW